MKPKLKHPFPCVIAGPTGCGKTQFVKNMNSRYHLKECLRGLFTVMEYQRAFMEMSAALPPPPQIRFVEGLPANMDLDPAYKTLII
ncbi:hypothetical protein HOLleu_09265 [Holothuria leucospilota]|uniref:Uncharacterized protein n=1 Tax=Holothuria leucospilota TaxID=206669 RepID=A0A9Q1CJJ9_HOLLE|nr:hypothetical protein HOLleu_09265 [Holothuria leucospilota]